MRLGINLRVISVSGMRILSIVKKVFLTTVSQQISLLDGPIVNRHNPVQIQGFRHLLILVAAASLLNPSTNRVHHFT